jgi:hypothetical protein
MNRFNISSYEHTDLLKLCPVSVEVKHYVVARTPQEE